MVDKYKITTKDLLKEGTFENLSGLKIAFTDSPAIKTKGLFFNPLVATKMPHYLNEDKMIVAAPVLIPNLPIDRKKGSYQYQIEFEPEVVEDLYYFFNSQTISEKFNNEHKSNEIVNATMLGSWIVEDPETDRAYTKFGLKVPKGTWFAEVKVNDKKYWEESVKNGEKYGFSIEAWLGTQLELNDLIDKKIKMNMSKNTKKRFKLNAIESIKFKTNKLKFAEVPEEEIMEVISENLEVGTEVEIVTVEGEVVADYTGELVIENGGDLVDVKIEEGVITESEKEEEEMNEDDKEKDKLEDAPAQTCNCPNVDEIKAVINEILEPLMIEISTKLGEIESKLGTQLKLSVKTQEEDKPMSFEDRVKVYKSVKNN